MLIEFSVTNFRSIKERQTLSLVAKKEPGHQGNVFDCPGLKNTKLVKSAVLYGANASGKSNVLRAAMYMFNYVINSATKKPDENTGVTPFVLDDQSKDGPSEFEVHFVHDGVRYQYGFSLDGAHIHTEWLTAYPHGRPQRWFSREFNPEKQDYYWSFASSLPGDKKTIERATNKNTLALSMGAHLKHQELAKVQDWFQERIRNLDYAKMGLDEALKRSIALAVTLSEKTGLDSVRLGALVQQADLGIGQIELKEGRLEDELSFPDDAPEEMKEVFVAIRKLNESLLKDGKAAPLPEIVWHHRGPDSKNNAAFREEDESAGTVKFFSLLVPLLVSLDRGYTVFIDEIAAYMHPLLVRHLLALVHNPAFNRKGAQWIFSTHDVTLLDTALFRRDQVWFTEKNRQGATTLYPLSDFKPRKDEALQKGYLAGRYGAIPFFGGEFTF